MTQSAAIIQVIYTMVHLGARLVYIQPTNLSSLTDIHLTSIGNGNILKYDTSSSKWIKSNDIDNLSLLSDVTISTPLNNQSLIYDSTLTKWKNSQLDHTTLSNIGSNTC